MAVPELLYSLVTYPGLLGWAPLEFGYRAWLLHQINSIGLGAVSGRALDLVETIRLAIAFQAHAIVHTSRRKPSLGIAKELPEDRCQQIWHPLFVVDRAYTSPTQSRVLELSKPNGDALVAEVVGILKGLHPLVEFINQ